MRRKTPSIGQTTGHGDETPHLMVFSKHLAGPPMAEIGERLRTMEIGAIDLTVRPGGHVDPLRVADDLPAAADALARWGVRIAMVSTEVTDAHADADRAVLEAVSAAGIRYYKMGYFRYRSFGSLRKLRAQVAARLVDLAQLNAELGLHGGFHNHSDAFFGAVLHDVAHVLEGVPAEHVGAYLDPAHAVIEGGSCGWKMGMDLLDGRITMLAVKDFQWARGTHRYAGGRRHSVEFCPLEEGNTPWPGVLTLLRRGGFAGPISLHSEYQGSHSFRDLTVDEVFEQTAMDARRFRQWWNAAAPRAEAAEPLAPVACEG